MESPEREQQAVPPLFASAPTFQGDLLCPKAVNRHYRQVRWHAFAAFYADEAILGRFRQLLAQSRTFRVGGYRHLYEKKMDVAHPVASAPGAAAINSWETVEDFDWSSFYLFDPPTGFFLFKDQIHFLVLNDAYGIGSRFLGRPLTLHLREWANGDEIAEYGRQLAALTGEHG